MKKLILFAIAIATVSFASAQKVQETEVPTVVKTGLQKQHPAVKNVKWEKEDGNYEASFKEQQTDYSILLTPKGNIVETEVAIAFKTLPAPAKDYVHSHYANKEIKETAKITSVKGTVTYEVEVDEKDLIFDHSGKFLAIDKD
ncbi:MAG: hypothetical protein M9898_11405 [Chitinophagaceae bacterium]|nr:hypothetical protein [Chitinophagaceae bacterium]